MTQTAPACTETPAAPVEFVQHLRRPSPWQTGVSSIATGEPAPTPGLLVAPRMHRTDQGWRFRGDWHVVHQPSGRTVPPAPRGLGLGQARDLAALLAETGFDWTQPADALTHPDSQVRAACLDLVDRVEDAVEAAEPLRTRASSWKQFPPLYSLLDTAPEGAGVDEEYKFLTYRAAADFVLDCELHTLTIYRDPTPAWGLRCAWTDCQTPLVDGEFELPTRCDDRTALATEANRQQWRPLDARRWLCPPCSHQFTPAHPY